MSDMWASPGDPLFWLHHGMLDNIWNQWQRASKLDISRTLQLTNTNFIVDFTTRKSEVGGPDTM